MSVVIVDINEKTMEKTKLYDSKNETLSLQEYMTVAKRTIGRFASPSVARQMLNSEDAISFITEHLIKATLRWKEDGGRTLRSYLNQCAIWAIQRWIDNMKMSAKNMTISLDTPLDDNGNTMYNLVEDKKNNNHDESPNIEEILDKPYLNEVQKECLRMKFVDGMTFRAIGIALNKSGSRIEQIVSRALEKLRSDL